MPANLGIKIINSPAPSAYPITSQTFIVVNKDLCKAGIPGGEAAAKGVVKFLDYGLGEGQAILAQADYAALPAAILAKSKEARRGPAVQRHLARRLIATPRPHDPIDNAAVEAASIPGGERSILERSPLARLPDRALKYGLTALAALILALIVYFFIRLVGEARPAFAKEGVLGFIFGNDWNVSAEHFGALPLLVGTLITSALALLIGVPVAVATAVYATELCPLRLRAPLTMLVELLAAVPSVVYGLWGIFFLAPEAAAGRAVGRRPAVVHPVHRRRPRDDPQLLHHRARARDHDPADRQRDQPRGDERRCPPTTRRRRSASARRAGR